MKDQGLTVVIDTREQHPWSFPELVRVERRKLDAGDYSLPGLESRVAIERKNPEDLVQTIISERRRFVAELKKLARMRVAAVVVECSLPWVLEGKYSTLVDPEVVVAAVASISVDWGVPVFFCGGRAEAATFARHLLQRAKRKCAVREGGAP